MNKDFELHYRWAELVTLARAYARNGASRRWLGDK